MRTIELWVLYLVVVYLNLLQMLVVCLKLKQMFQLAMCRVCLLVASVAAFVAGRLVDFFDRWLAFLLNG